MREKILPPYAPTLIESTRAMGYSLEAAVADIIDNSVAADAKKIDLFFFPIDGAYIAILDNGTGMSDSELDKAMQYGSRSPSDKRASDDLGRFGLGLKTASLSQCRRLTVVSKQGDSVSARRWDLDYVAEKGDWSLLVLDRAEIADLPQIDELMKYESGTLVVWQELDRLKAGETDFEKVLGRKIDDVRDHLSLVYHRYLAGEPGHARIRILINNSGVEPADPFLEGKSVRAMDDETIIVRREKITVRLYILPHISKMTKEELDRLGGKDGLRRSQGFYVYRNRRLLIWGTWFKMMRQGDMSRLARIRVDIPNTLDDLWTLDIKKSSAMPPAEVRTALGSIIERLADKSRRTWTYRGKKEVSDTGIHVWNRMKNQCGGYYYEINRENPLVKKLYEQNQRTLTDALLKQIERGLPLNQLYVDMNSDEQIANDDEQDIDEVVSALRAIVGTAGGRAEKMSMLDAVSGIDPFSQYPEAVEKVREEIENE